MIFKLLIIIIICLLLNKYVDLQSTTTINQLISCNNLKTLTYFIVFINNF